jgi:hypothetical protein
MRPEQVGDALFYGVVGIILGGRIGYVLFYNFSAFLSDPLMLVRIWEGGMSFHGGLIGAPAGVLALWAQTGRPVLPDHGFHRAAGPPSGWAPGVSATGSTASSGASHGRALGHGLSGRGHAAAPSRPALSGGARGVALFVILWVFARHQRPVGAVSGLFLILYGSVPVRRGVRARARRAHRLPRLRLADHGPGAHPTLPMDRSLGARYHDKSLGLPAQVHIGRPRPQEDPWPLYLYPCTCPHETVPRPHAPRAGTRHGEIRPHRHRHDSACSATRCASISRRLPPRHHQEGAH